MIRRIPEWAFTSIVLVAACAASLYLRIALPYNTVFNAGWIKLTGIDAYFYMRLVDNLLHNFPQLFSFDPYNVFPGGNFLTNLPTFFAYLLASIIKLLGGGAATPQAADTIAVYIPAVLGAITVIPVYFIGRALVNHWAGLVAAVTLAVMPGEILSRSILGYTDHHIAEVLFTTGFIVFFILAVKQGSEFTYAMVKEGHLTPASRHIPYSIVAGIFLGLYLITWQGAPLFVFMILIFFVLQFVSDHLRGIPTDYLSKTAITCFLIALLIFVPALRDKITLLSLATVILVPIALNIVSAIMTARGIRPVYYVVAVGIMAVMGLLATWLFARSVFDSFTGYIFSIFSWRMQQSVVGEMKSLFFPGDTFTLEMAWNEYALTLYSGLAGLALLIYRCVKKGAPEHIFVATWSVVMMLAAFAMVRFSYYFEVCVAVTTGYLAGAVISAFPVYETGEAVKKQFKKARREAEQLRKSASRQAVAVVTVLIAAAIVLAPGTAIAMYEASNPTHAPSNAWMQALEWLKKSTPEPFVSADYYYALYSTPANGKGYDYPASVYSIAVWNDYGYWVTRIGHRIPVTNPSTTGLNKEAPYFTSQDSTTAAAIMNQWKAKYVIVDGRIASPNDKFYALAYLSGKNEADYYELCWQKKEGKYTPVLVFYPEFYRATVIRLYNFDAKPVTPQNTPVMAYQEQVLPDGQKFKEITGLRNFRTYGEAQSFIDSQKSGQFKIIGTDPLMSPVPLDQFKGYNLVYQSTEKASAGSSPVPVIKIFEYNPGS